ncbi:MAG: hypothetical protein OWV35_02210 [Firmicutes bacterium]|nr:hypothetical protein [Bacillota bacterium]
MEPHEAALVEAIRARFGHPVIAWDWVVQEPGDIGWFVATLDDGRVVWGDDQEPVADRMRWGPDRASALADMRQDLVYSAADALCAKEDQGRYAATCPVCGEGRPLVAVKPDGTGYWQPCPQHPEGDWTRPILDVALDQGLLQWVSPAVRAAQKEG